MHQKNTDEMTELEKVDNRVQSIEDALAAKGIEIVRAIPIILGRDPRETADVSLIVTKSRGGIRMIRVITEGQTRDSIAIQDWDVDISMEPGTQPMKKVEGWLELTDARLMHPQKCWAQGNVDVEGVIEQGDHVAIRFNNLGWNAQATITNVAGRRIFFVEREPCAISEPGRVNEYNEYRKDQRLLDRPDDHGQELVLKTVGLVGQTVIKDWRNGRPGPNVAFNERSTIPGSIPIPGESTGRYRQIPIWCSRYKNSSKDGISMTVDLPIRRK